MTQPKTTQPSGEGWAGTSGEVLQDLAAFYSRSHAVQNKKNGATVYVQQVHLSP